MLVDPGYESGSGSPLRQMSPMETTHRDPTDDLQLLDVFEPVAAEQFNYTPNENREQNQITCKEKSCRAVY